MGAGAAKTLYADSVTFHDIKVTRQKNGAYKVKAIMCLTNFKIDDYYNNICAGDEARFPVSFIGRADLTESEKYSGERLSNTEIITEIKRALEDFDEPYEEMGYGGWSSTDVKDDKYGDRSRLSSGIIEQEIVLYLTTDENGYRNRDYFDFVLPFVYGKDLIDFVDEWFDDDVEYIEEDIEGLNGRRRHRTVNGRIRRRYAR